MGHAVVAWRQHMKLCPNGSRLWCIGVEGSFWGAEGNGFLFLTLTVLKFRFLIVTLTDSKVMLVSGACCQAVTVPYEMFAERGPAIICHSLIIM